MDRTDEDRAERGIRRRDEIGPIRQMATAENHVMVRRPHCYPFVLTVKEWNELPELEPQKPKRSKSQTPCTCRYNDWCSADKHVDLRGFKS